ncbi:serine hydrolase domain-containing protein [Thermus thermamylovorans]|uniref:serine hydrolase domain-containing protein n=1 Tax=Thermus thermamylovorans TaxID=2509362 RepID=UPI00137577A5|nr:serine hydrolase domain-containing protein [Thermus thermamylovorans]
MAPWETLEAFVRERLRRSRLPGLSLAVVRGEEVAYARGFGFRDLERKLPATPTTRYGIGSVTKSFTALALMQLVEEGKLSLEDPVERFLPLRVRPFGEPVRVEHLLAHTSGIPALAYAEAEIRYDQGTGGRPLALAAVADFVAWLNGAEGWAEARPGERWFYLNEGYVLLGGIIQELSGLSYGEYLRERVLKPLGMEATGFLGEEAPELATPYLVPPEGRPRPGRAAPMAVGSDGALVSTALDLALYLRMWLRRGAPLVGEEAYRELLRPRVPVPGEPLWPGPLGPAQYALGLMVQPFFGRTLVGHGGSVLVYTAHLAFLPEEGLGVAVLANGSGYPLAQIAQAALALLLGEPLEALPFYRLEALGERIFGLYATYGDTLRVTLRPQAGGVELRVEDREAPQSVLLAWEALGEGEVRLRALLGDRALPVAVRLSDPPVLLYERYKLRRVGGLA